MAFCLNGTKPIICALEQQNVIVLGPEKAPAGMGTPTAYFDA